MIDKNCSYHEVAEYVEPITANKIVDLAGAGAGMVVRTRTTTRGPDDKIAFTGLEEIPIKDLSPRFRVSVVDGPYGRFVRAKRAG